MTWSLRAEGLGKRYRIGARASAYETLRESLARGARSAFGRGATDDEAEHIWALRDASFEVERGTVVGIIGANGAGKSTMLKILSRITEPTEGRAELRGRVGSLLEVGTGFHPELTGRENIYLSGAILGMRRREIDTKLDRIVDFAEVTRFVDTSVKHYSTGMYLRLAFAVAAHLETEILLVDEVLAVGDAGFRKRCLGKMGEVASGGRTVLLVSHNMASIRQLASSCLLIDRGRIRASGEPSAVIGDYLSARTATGTVLEPTEETLRSGTGEGRILSFAIRDREGHESSRIGIAEPFTLRMDLEIPSGSPAMVCGFEVWSLDGTRIANIRSDAQSWTAPGDAGRSVVSARLPGLPLTPGTYRIEPWFAFLRGPRVDHLHEGLALELESRGHLESERLVQPGRGLLLVDCEWSSAPVSDEG